MAYNLPKAWTPGLALPGYVRAEGLQRRAFVTQWAPDGTYDNPKVGDGGFVQPQYALDEGYGGGAFITKWAPRGSYFGPRIPHFLDYATSKIGKAQNIGKGGYEYNLTSLSGLGDTSSASIDQTLPEPFETFGTRASAVILNDAAKLPAKDRRAHVKAVLDKIDRSLWARTAGIAGVLAKAGMSPQRALARGMAKALGSGMAAEVIKTGHTKQPPPPKGILGLGCYGHADGKPIALGATPISVAAAAHATGALNMPCFSNPPPGYTWDAACPTGKKSARGTPIIGCFRPLGPGEPAIKKQGTNVCVTWADMQTNYHGEPSYNVGPFPIPIDASTYRFQWQTPSALGALPPDWLGAIQAAFNPKTPGKDNPNPQTVSGSTISPGVLDYFNALGVAQPIDMNVIATPKGFEAHWYDAIPGVGWLGLLPGVVDAVYQGIANVDDLTGPPQPIAQFQHPKTGDQWGAWINIEPRNAGAPDPVKNPVVMSITFGKIPDSPWYSNLLADLFWPVVELTKGVKIAVQTTLSVVGALACAAVSGPGAVQGSATAGGLAGGPPGAAAGAAGASIAALACGTQPVYAPQDSWVLPIVIAAAIGGIAYVFTRPVKKKPTGTAPKPAGG